MSVYEKLLKCILWVGKRNSRVIAADFFSLIFAVYIGFALRLSYDISGEYMPAFIKSALAFASIVTIALFLGKNYTIFWPRASVEEFANLARWYFAGGAVFLVIVNFTDMIHIPRLSQAFLLLAGLFFLSSLRTLWRLSILPQHKSTEGMNRVLIVGAGEAGSMLARDIVRHGASFPIGFIDDNAELKKARIANLPVLGKKEDLPAVIKNNTIDTVLIAMPSATGAQIKEYLDVLDKEDVTVRILPSLLSLADGQVSVSKLRSVKFEDLLRRDPVTLDNENIESLIKGKCVLVTGAGGSIGSEICRQVLARKPEKLLALGHGEQSIYLLMESLADAGNRIPVLPIIADVADETTMESIFKRFSPDIVFHAGAHKHVPLMEENPREALRVNAFGTWNIATLAGKHNVERFVMISTDKAVRPTSVMGATKRAAERLLLSVQQEYPGTKYMAVRFGNVLGSRGSVVPKFERQIAAGGPVTVTHPDMKRYFMLIPEAVSLVLQTGTMGEGGELFVLDMGKPVKISEMAETLIRLHGHEPNKDIQIEYSGIRTGEKLYEELFYDPSHVDTTKHAKIFKSKLTPDTESILPEVETILDNAAKGQITGDKLKETILALGCEAGINNGR
ncbi:MAG: nucleoside-diphosphate sugar epimerase/dehydratase [Synergistaceae bacterium]|nr:nucleoside-diphosphate sugar epimerase/dehydratase [Synergistaceae bacterium]